MDDPCVIHLHYGQCIVDVASHTAETENGMQREREREKERERKG